MAVVPPRRLAHLYPTREQLSHSEQTATSTKAIGPAKGQKSAVANVESAKSILNVPIARHCPVDGFSRR